jgi:signal transduction histidine kinase
VNRVHASIRNENKMPAAAIPQDEDSRLLDLRRYQILDSDPEEAFEGLTLLARQLAETPFALVSLTDDSRQWFKARVGVTLQQIPREWAPCAHVVFERRSIVCNDMQFDARFADNPLVTGPPHVRFYAGMALMTPRGAILGTLAVMDTVPRVLSPIQVEALTLLARQVVDALELRMAYRDLSALRVREKDLERRLGAERVDEAQRLAAELHDGVGQDLAGLSLLLSGFLRSPAAQSKTVSDPISNVAQLLRECVARCRQVSEGYGGFLVRREGVVGALRCFVGRLTQPGIQIDIGGAEIPSQSIDESAAYYLFGIGHEAVTNACRHSGGSVVRVLCEQRDGHIELSVEDNGSGLSPSGTGRGLGLSVMQYRARAIGAELHFETPQGGGLRVTCRLPRRAHVEKPN